MFVTSKNEAIKSLRKRNEAKIFLSFRFEAKNSKRNEAKTSEKIGPVFSLEEAKTKRNGSRFASFRFEAKKKFKRNRRTLGFGGFSSDFDAGINLLPPAPLTTKFVKS
jgi:hypothetical protein